ncbi:MLO-like protein 12 isoform X2 [Tasmannia lanceolata]|uniref:MLO-like protein 12 isoform X2 n=1 Tax=Tasmannia lanceolata TaxID=3420 RepID=UPI004064B66E
MAGGGGGAGSRSLEQTPTWAVAIVCFVLVVISILIEHILHVIGKWLMNHHKRALYEALEKVKSGQTPISEICIPMSVGNSWHPCTRKYEISTSTRNLISNSENNSRRILAGGGGGSDKCAPKGKVPLISAQGINQLHIFIFVLAVFHILYCITTMALGRAKMRSWKNWEGESKSVEYQYSHDPERFRIARETSFGRRHLNFWSRSPILIWILCFFRQFVPSVAKVDYLTLRHGFIVAPPPRWVKLNFDGSSVENLGKAGIGGVIRDANGSILMTYSGPPGICEAKVRALLFGFKWFAAINLGPLIIEGDSSNTVSWATEHSRGPWRKHNYIAEIRDLVRIIRPKIEHRRRSANEVADQMAKQGVNLESMSIVRPSVDKGTGEDLI